MAIPAGPDELDQEWLDEALFHCPAFLNLVVEGVRTEVVGAEFGLDGTLARATITPQGRGAPFGVIAKWTNARKGAAEARFYREIAPRLDLDVPVLYASAVDALEDRSVLLLEDFGHARQGDVLAGCSPTEAHALARAAARLHGATWQPEDLGFMPSWGPHPEGNAERVIARRDRFLERFGDSLAPDVRAFVDDLGQSLPDAVRGLLAAPRCVVHTDFHTDNVLFPVPERPVILDWPGARLGPGALDLGRLLGESLDVEVRRSIQDALVTTYVTNLRDMGVADYGDEDLRRDLRHAATYHFGGMVGWAGRSDPPAAAPRVAELTASGVARSAALLRDLGLTEGERP